MDRSPNDYTHYGAYETLDEIRYLLLEGRQKDAHELAMKEFMSVPLNQKEYQPFGDLYLEFPDHHTYSDYHRELDIENAICRTSYEVQGAKYSREIIASSPHQVIAIHLKTDLNKALDFKIWLDAEHKAKEIKTWKKSQSLNVEVKDGALTGTARIIVDTDGITNSEGARIHVVDATYATIWLIASTNYTRYNDVSKVAGAELESVIKGLKGISFDKVKKSHIKDYRNLFDRFKIDFRNNLGDSLPTDQRIEKFNESPEDPQLLALYTQYGRYLLISSSRRGTHPANLQGIWNKDLKPAWGSKYTININTEMNYWPAEVTNLSECHEPLFKMIKECSETGRRVVREHYDADGWVSGSGWLTHHLWEHYLFTRDETFLREEAYPLMKGAALFYSEYLVENPVTGWWISTPSNSPENGGMVAGPTMDHQIIRSLFNACIAATEILDTDHQFAAELKDLSRNIAPNQIGQYGQLQE